MRPGLRLLTAALLLAGMAPATVLLVLESRANLAHVRSAARSEVSSVARLVAERNQRYVELARGTLLAISRLPSLRGSSAEACSAELAAIATATDLWAGLAASSPDGRMVCSAFPRTGPVNLGDRAFFQRALRTGGFAAGDFVVTRVRGLGAIGFGYPVRDAGGKVVAVASASLRVDSLQAQLESLPLPPGASVEVVDRNGSVVLRRQDASEAAGAAPFGAAITRLAMSGARLHEGTGGDGIRRVFGFDRVDSPDGTVLWVIAAEPLEVVEEPARALARRTLGVWGLAVALILAGTGFVAERLIIRRLRALAQTARRIAAGDSGARTGLPPHRDELGELVSAFDEMAGSLEELQRQNRRVLDSIGDGIVGVDREARVVFANPAAARLLGLPGAELLARPFAELVERAGPREDPCLVRQSLADGQVHLAADDAFTRRDGQAFPVESVTTPVVEGGRIVGAVVALRDASERRRLEEQLRQAQKMEAVGQLAGGVAHDFNNLLTAIVTCARMVQESLAPNHPAQPDVEEILASADRAAQLTRQLLAFARRQRVAPRAMDLRATVAGMERMLRRVLGETIDLRVELGPEPLVIHADPGQVEMVVLNLAVNARDAMPSGGDLTLAVSRADAGEPRAGALGSAAMAQLLVRDSGVGMDGDTQERMFEPFFTTKPTGQGTGLGLATVYGIVKQSDGIIRVRSMPGKGTELRVLFPLLPSPGAEAPAEDAAPAAGGSERVLVVEDDEVLRTLVCRALTGAGYRVAEAARPSAALDRDEVDLLVTDLVLPEQSGWQLFRRIAARNPGLRLLVMSGFVAEPAPGSSLPPGVPFLAKPFAPRDLLFKVRQALDGPPPEG